MTTQRFWASLLTIVVIFTAVSEISAQERQRRGGRRQAVAGKLPPSPPIVGAAAPKLELKTLQDETVSLAKLTDDHDVVLLVLRGWPGYQCPICSRQVGEFLQKEKEFAKLGVEVVMVYPGPADLLAEHAEEFRGESLFPDHFHYVTDPDYVFTNDWGLRWEAERETAYPSTFIVGKGGKVKYGVTSITHGDRASAAAILEELAKPSVE